MNYLIKGGDTFTIKEDLKAFACKWNANEKCWETPYIDKEFEEITYKRLKSLCASVGASMIPRELSEECKKIQKILGGTR